MKDPSFAGVKQFVRPRMNLLIIVMIILSFVVIDIVLVPIITGIQVKATPEYRCCLDHLTYGELKSFIDRVNRDKSPKIILTGDSVIHGGGVRDGDETIAHFLQQEINKSTNRYHIYNLGLKGAYSGDVYFIIKSLRLTEKDIVIYDLNLNQWDKPLTQFPHVSSLLASSDHSGVDLDTILHISTNKSIEDQLQNFLTQHWRLYANRVLIKNIRIKKSLKEPEPASTYQFWHEKNWDDKLGKYAQRGATPITVQHPFMLMSLYVSNVVIEEKAKMLIFNMPLNHELLDKYKEIDRLGYDRNKNFMKTAFEEAGAAYRDYEFIVPSPYFTDTLHPTKEGNRIIAEQLAADLSTWINEGGSVE